MKNEILGTISGAILASYMVPFIFKIGKPIPIFDRTFTIGFISICALSLLSDLKANRAL